MQRSTNHWALFPLIATSIAFGVAVLALSFGIYIARNILIILFLSVLFAVFLTRASTTLHGATKLPYKGALALLIALLLGVSGGFATFFGSRVRAEVNRATESFDEAKVELSRKLQQHPNISALLQDIPLVDRWFSSVISGKNRSEDSAKEKSAARDEESAAPDNDKQAGTDSTRDDESKSGKTNSQSHETVRSVAASAIGAVGGMMKASAGIILNSLIIFFVGLFLAANPEASRDGMVNLVQRDGRDETRKVMNCLGDSLWKWLIGRFATMAITGIGIGVGLAVLGVPMAALLGVITALLTFVPNIGGAMALGLAMFVALPSGLATVGLVVGLFLMFQLVESYLITPLIQQHQVNIPPALLIAVQAVFGILLGFLGAMIASPMVVVGLVIHREVYHKHLLKEG